MLLLCGSLAMEGKGGPGGGDTKIDSQGLLDRCMLSRPEGSWLICRQKGAIPGSGWKS